MEHNRIICSRFWNLDHYDDSMSVIILSVSEQCHFDECCYSECRCVNKRTYSFKDGISSLKPNQKHKITDILINLIQTSLGWLKGNSIVLCPTLVLGHFVYVAFRQTLKKKTSLTFPNLTFASRVPYLSLAPFTLLKCRSHSLTRQHSSFLTIKKVHKTLFGHYYPHPLTNATKPGLSFHSRSGCVKATMHLLCYKAKLPDLKVKTQSPQFLGDLVMYWSTPLTVCSKWCHDTQQNDTRCIGGVSLF